MNGSSATEGDFLLSLDSDLYQHPVLIKYSVLVQALFARRVCLTDTQIIESPALEDFFLNNKNELTDEIQQADASAPPILGTCTRKQLGPDILAVLDSMLEPNLYTGLPAYFSRLTPEQNVALRAGFDQLHTAEERRRAFLNIAGRRTEQYLKNAASYFEQHPLAVVWASDAQQRPLLTRCVRN